MAKLLNFKLRLFENITKLWGIVQVQKNLVNYKANIKFSLCDFKEVLFKKMFSFEDLYNVPCSIE